MRNLIKKIVKISLIILIAIIVLCALALKYIFAGRIPSPFGVRSADAYLCGEYKKYSGGEAAEEYFPEPEDIGEYEKIGFIFVNNWWKSRIFYKWGNTFMLDVVYTEDNYNVNTAKTIEKYGLKEYDEGYVFSSNDEALTFYKEIQRDKDGNRFDGFYIMFYDDLNMIRYVFSENNSSSGIKEFIDLHIKIRGFVPNDEFESAQKEKYYY